jgi:hypothetical protein
MMVQRRALIEDGVVQDAVQNALEAACSTPSGLPRTAPTAYPSTVASISAGDVHAPAEGRQLETPPHLRLFQQDTGLQILATMQLVLQQMTRIANCLEEQRHPPQEQAPAPAPSRHRPNLPCAEPKSNKRKRNG